MATYTAPTISGYNQSPPDDDGSNISTNLVKWSTHIDKLGDPLKNHIDAVSTAASNAFNKIDTARPVSVTDYGAAGDGATDDTAAFIAWAAALSTNSVGIVPSGTYYLNTETGGSIEFDGSNITILAFGAKFIEYGTASVMFVTNADATAGEADVQHNWRWFGGWFVSNTAATGGGNSNTCFRVRGVTRGGIYHAYGVDMGGSFVELAPRDAFYLSDVHGWKNTYHVYIPEYLTTGNPQAMVIEKCGFSTHYTAGIYVESSLTDFKIRDNYFIGKDSIVLETGGDGSFGNLNNQAIRIEGNSFEQGTTGEFYIRTVNSNSKTLFGLELYTNNFQTGATKCISLVNCTDAYVFGNYFVSTEAGFVTLDSNCTRIHFGANRYQGYNSWSQGLTYSCDRDEIIFSEETVIKDPIQLVGWGFTGISTGTGTIDMSTAAGAYWTGQEETKFCPPKAWILRVRVADATPSSSTGILLQKDNSETDTYSARCMVPSWAASDEEVNYNVTVRCDDSGDIYYDATASTSGTLDVGIYLVGWIR